MGNSTLIRCSTEAHRRLKIKSATEGRPIMEIIDDMVEPQLPVFNNGKKRRFI